MGRPEGRPPPRRRPRLSDHLGPEVLRLPAGVFYGGEWIWLCIAVSCSVDRCVVQPVVRRARSLINAQPMHPPTPTPPSLTPPAAARKRSQALTFTWTDSPVNKRPLRH